MQALAFCAAAAGSGVLHAQNAAVENRIVDACQFIEDKNVKEAVRLLQEVRRDAPDNDAACFYLGQAAADAGNVEEAIGLMENAVRLDSMNFWYRKTLASLYARNGDFDKGISGYEQLLKDFPKETTVYFELATLYERTRKYDRVLAVLEQVEDIFGKSGYTTLLRDNFLCLLHREDEAFQVLEAYNREFSSPEVLTRMGDHEKFQYRDSAAFAYYDEALALDRDFPAAIGGKSDIFLRQRKYRDFLALVGKLAANPAAPDNMLVFYTNLIADRDNRRIREACPEQTDSLMEALARQHSGDSLFIVPLAQYQYDNGRKDKAEDLLDGLQQANPDDLRLYMRYLVYLIFTKNDPRKAIDRIRTEGYSRFPANMEVARLLNAALYRTKDYRGIIENCEMLLAEGRPDRSERLELMSEIGDTYYLLKEPAKAFRIFEKILKSDKDYVLVLNNYAYYLSIEGKRLNKAYRMSLKTVEAEPDNPTYLDTLGWIAFLQGRTEEAKARFKQAMLYGGKESATIIRHYVAVLERLGEKDLAAYYSKLAENLEQRQ